MDSFLTPMRSSQTAEKTWNSFLIGVLKNLKGLATLVKLFERNQIKDDLALMFIRNAVRKTYNRLGKAGSVQKS